MRGKGRCTSASLVSKGITPAYAGKSRGKESADSFPWDHPRLCGEKDIQNVLDAPNEGITPAYAGKSLTVGVLWIHDEDHPRLCGEKSAISSENCCLIRITPAYAGKRHKPAKFQK